MKRKLIILGAKIAIICLSIYILFFCIFGFSRISSYAMAPNLVGGDLAFYYRLGHDYEIGDVVTFRRDGKRYFMRVVAKPGSNVSIRNGLLFVDDIPENDSHVFMGETSEENAKVNLPYFVEQDSLFLMGDNRDEDEGSHVFGTVKIDEIDGKVISILRTREV